MRIHTVTGPTVASRGASPRHSSPSSVFVDHHKAVAVIAPSKETKFVPESKASNACTTNDVNAEKVEEKKISFRDKLKLFEAKTPKSKEPALPPTTFNSDKSSFVKNRLKLMEQQQTTSQDVKEAVKPAWQQHCRARKLAVTATSTPNSDSTTKATEAGKILIDKELRELPESNNHSEKTFQEEKKEEILDINNEPERKPAERSSFSKTSSFTHYSNVETMSAKTKKPPPRTHPDPTSQSQNIDGTMDEEDEKNVPTVKDHMVAIQKALKMSDTSTPLSNSTVSPVPEQALAPPQAPSLVASSALSERMEKRSDGNDCDRTDSDGNDFDRKDNDRTDFDGQNSDAANCDGKDNDGKYSDGEGFRRKDNDRSNCDGTDSDGKDGRDCDGKERNETVNEGKEYDENSCRNNRKIVSSCSQESESLANGCETEKNRNRASINVR